MRRELPIAGERADPNAPPVIFSGYLAPDESTQGLTLYSDVNGVYTEAQYMQSVAEAAGQTVQA